MKIPRVHIYNYERMQSDRATFYFRLTILKITLLILLLVLLLTSIYANQ